MKHSSTRLFLTHSPLRPVGLKSLHLLMLVLREACAGRGATGEGEPGDKTYCFSTILFGLRLLPVVEVSKENAVLPKKSLSDVPVFCVLFAETVNTSVPFSFKGILFSKVLSKSHFVLSSFLAVTDV